MVKTSKDKASKGKCRRTCKMSVFVVFFFEENVPVLQH